MNCDCEQNPDPESRIKPCSFQIVIVKSYELCGEEGFAGDGYECSCIPEAIQTNVERMISESLMYNFLSESGGIK